MISRTVRLPSQRWTISRLGPLRRRARSGIRRTCWLLFWPRRTPGARRGWELRSTFIFPSQSSQSSLSRMGQHASRRKPTDGSVDLSLNIFLTCALSHKNSRPPMSAELAAFRDPGYFAVRVSFASIRDTCCVCIRCSWHHESTYSVRMRRGADCRELRRRGEGRRAGPRGCRTWRAGRCERRLVRHGCGRV
jgi:hypothetical protein